MRLLLRTISWLRTTAPHSPGGKSGQRGCESSHEQPCRVRGVPHRRSHAQAERFFHRSRATRLRRPCPPRFTRLCRWMGRRAKLERQRRQLEPRRNELGRFCWCIKWWIVRWWVVQQRLLRRARLVPAATAFLRAGRSALLPSRVLWTSVLGPSPNRVLPAGDRACDVSAAGRCGTEYLFRGPTGRQCGGGRCGKQRGRLLLVFLRAERRDGDRNGVCIGPRCAAGRLRVGTFPSRDVCESESDDGGADLRARSAAGCACCSAGSTSTRDGVSVDGCVRSS